MASKPVTAPDLHFLNAAIGWLELGNHQEAAAEIEQISYLTRFHPDVLVVRWKVFARTRNWERSLDVARALVKIAPDRPTGWICQAYSLYNTKRSVEAWMKLVVAAKKFPKISAIPYFLACLATQMGNKDEATRWLNRWNEMTGKPAANGTPSGASENAEGDWQEFNEDFVMKPQVATQPRDLKSQTP